MTNILRIVIRQSEELLQFLDSGRSWPGSDGLNLVRVSTNTTSFYYVAQVFHGSLTKEALLTLCIQLLTTQPIKHITQILHVLLLIRAENENVVQVYSHATHQVRERQVHKTLESRRRIG